MGYNAPIVALTAFAEESNIKDCLDSGMNHFLSKPIRRPQLKKVLKQYIAPIPEEGADDQVASVPAGGDQHTAAEAFRATSTRRAAAALPPRSTPSPGTVARDPLDILSPQVISAQHSIALGYFGPSSHAHSGDVDKPLTPFHRDSMV
jgi:osomolarity two-component system sensor histidine kinase SLN1